MHTDIDYVIQNGTIVDGTGNAPFRGDVAIAGEKIAGVAEKIPHSGKTIDASGMVVTPGFIDIHTHSDLFLLDQHREPIKLRQGITTEIVGNCGFTPAPVAPEHEGLLRSYARPVMGEASTPFSWRGFAGYIDRIDNRTYPNHYGTLAGNGAIRIAVKGFSKSPMTEAELNLAVAYLDEALGAGAFGLSVGLMYVPENYYRSSELETLCRVVKRHDSILTAHIRGEGDSLVPSIREILDLGERAEIPVHISHLKAAGKNNWGTALDAALASIERQRHRGFDVTCDVYPYDAGSTMLSSLLPPWLLEGGNAAAVARLQDRETRRRVEDELTRPGEGWDNLVRTTGWDRVLVAYSDGPYAAEVQGKNVARIAEEWGMSGDAAGLELFVSSGGNTGIVFFSMSPDDVLRVMKLEYASIISDSIFTADGQPHPRSYGAFPRVIEHYVNGGALDLATAVRKMTALPAQRMGITDRGVVEAGRQADLLIFDPRAIRATATYESSRRYAEGFSHIIVRGAAAVERDNVLSTDMGRFLKATGGV
ncbi:MAG: amidohydrolase family protein [Spirochaetales bacterium]|nr:amidohydrolase family protein [Spirochaetales bacterium]